MSCDSSQVFILVEGVDQWRPLWHTVSRTALLPLCYMHIQLMFQTQLCQHLTQPPGVIHGEKSLVQGHRTVGTREA